MQRLMPLAEDNTEQGGDPNKEKRQMADQT